jgi:hypothetical protein
MLSSWIRGFRVSKQMMASKQPSSPSFFKTVAAWFFARVCENLHTGATVSFFCSYKLVLANYSFFWRITEEKFRGIKKNSQSSSVAERAAAVSEQGQASASHTAAFHEHKHGSHRSQNHSPKPTTW